jgi:hypothetical protein
MCEKRGVSGVGLTHHDPTEEGREEVKERPIIMCGSMVKATLDDRKTMTRRVIKPQPVEIEDCDGIAGIRFNGKWHDCPYGSPGDRLWVKETWWCDNPATAQDIMSQGEGLYYRATEIHPEIFPKWKPSIFMPRWASRITLEITSVRVERLQEISGKDAVSEGCGQGIPLFELLHFGGYKKARDEFKDLWDSLNGKKYPWSSNPWVWCITFKRIP